MTSGLNSSMPQLFVQFNFFTTSIISFSDTALKYTELEFCFGKNLANLSVLPKDKEFFKDRPIFTKKLLK